MKLKHIIYALLCGILVSPIAIFVGLCVFKLGLLILIPDPAWHQIVPNQLFIISFILAVVGGGVLYYLNKHIVKKIIGTEYNMKLEKLRFKRGYMVAGVISGVGCSLLLRWIVIPMQGSNSFREFVVSFLIFFFVFPKIWDVILYLLKKVHIKDKYLSDVKDVCDTNLH